MAELDKKILIFHVDDDEDIRTITQIALEIDGGFEVVQFAAGQELLQATADKHPDIFLLDVMMPEMSGEDVWEKLKADSALRHVPVIFMTAKAEQVTSKDLVKKGALAVITKPFDPLTLGAEIKSVALQGTD